MFLKIKFQLPMTVNSIIPCLSGILYNSLVSNVKKMKSKLEFKFKLYSTVWLQLFGHSPLDLRISVAVFVFIIKSKRDHLLQQQLPWLLCLWKLFWRVVKNTGHYSFRKKWKKLAKCFALTQSQHNEPDRRNWSVIRTEDSKMANNLSERQL